MFSPYIKHDVDVARSSSSASPPSSPVNKKPHDFQNTTQRRMGNFNSHLSDITVDLGYPPRRDSTKRTPSSGGSYFSIKDKMLEPRRFFQYNNNNGSSRKYRRQRTRWSRVALVGAGLLLFIFIFGYIPFFNFAKTASTLSSSPLAGGATTAEPQRDQLLLYRIIGNDLPPRHKEGQTLSNLHFILEHEPSFPNLRKIFLLNRISDPSSEAAVVRLLEKYNMEYIRVPFIEEEYKQIDFRLEHFTEPDFLHSDDYRRLSKVAKLRALDYTYHDKNLYAMNNVRLILSIFVSFFSLRKSSPFY